jgi:tRNA-dihydrouridine synthase 3
MDTVEEDSRDIPRSGYAPIKAEYIIQRQQHTIESTEDGAESKEKREKGMNKKRNFSTLTKSEVRARDLCFYTAQGEECPNVADDKCKKEHDVKEYLQNKEPDLENVKCPLYSLHGSCRYGLKCRMHRDHCVYDLSSLDDGFVILRKDDVEQMKTEFNLISKEVISSLRAKKYAFGKTNGLLSPEKNEGQVGVVVTDDDKDKAARKERFKNVFKDKTYLAPLTTVGNLPFRRLCKEMGVDITCSEMALAENIVYKPSGQEMALLKRHKSEDIFGIQVCGAHKDLLMKTVEFIENECSVDFVDLNVGCPIDLVYKRGMGSALLGRGHKLADIVSGMSSVAQNIGITVKLRTGINKGKYLAQALLPSLKSAGADLVTLHGRTREQRYTKLPDYQYIDQCGQTASRIGLPFYGNGDIMSYTDYYDRLENNHIDGLMLGRGALIKPWVFTEIKERRHYDISANERFDLMKKFCEFGLEHWGTDNEGINKTRRFLLEWHSFHCRYIPVGLLEVLPQKLNERPPPFCGRNELETLLASDNSADWIKLSEMILGKADSSFAFTPKHKSNSYEG